MGARLAAGILAALALLPLALAQTATLQPLVDGAQGTLRLGDATYAGPAVVSAPLAIEGVDQRTRIVAPGGTALTFDADGASVRFLRLDEADTGLRVTAGRVASAGPWMVERVGTGVRLDAGATLLLRNDPTIPLTTALAEGARIVFTRPTRIDVVDEAGAPLARAEIALLTPEGVALAQTPLAVDLPALVRTSAGDASPGDAWTVRVRAEGHDDAVVPASQVGASPIALRRTAIADPAPPAEDLGPAGADATPPETDPPATAATTTEGPATSSAAQETAPTSADADLVPDAPVDPPALPVAEEPLEQQSLEAPAPAAPEPAISPAQVAAAAAVTATTLGAAAGGSALLLRSERRLWKLALALAPLYTRLRRSELLASPLRERLLAHVREHPGVRYRELQRALGLPNGALAHHLRILLREKLVEEAREGHAVRFFVPGARPAEPSDTTERVLAYVRANPGATGAGVAGALGLTASLAGYHLQKLADEGRIERRREGVRVRAYEKAASPDAT